jgi:hypothetical protein
VARSFDSQEVAEAAGGVIYLLLWIPSLLDDPFGYGLRVLERGVDGHLV